MAERLAMTPPFDMLRGLQKWYPIIADREWLWKYRTYGENTGSMWLCVIGLEEYPWDGISVEGDIIVEQWYF